VNDRRQQALDSSLIVRAGALCAVAGAVSLTAQQVWDLVSGQAIEIDLPLIGSALYASQIMLFAVAVVGLYLHQRTAFATFGQVATLVAIAGTLLWSCSAANQALDVLNTGQPPGDEISTGMLAWFFVAFGSYVVGLILFAVATYRAKVLPRGAAVLVVLGIPLGLALDGVLPGALVIYGAGIAWWGLATLAQLRAARLAQHTRTTTPEPAAAANPAAERARTTPRRRAAARGTLQR
jgi:hypothetical protein